MVPSKTENELRELGVQLRGHGAPIDTESLTVVDQARSRTASLYRCAAGPGEFVIKMVPGWSAAEAKDAHLALSRNATIFDGLDHLNGIPPVGWTDEPATLWTEYVPGNDLTVLLRDVERLRSDEGSAEAIRWIQACATGLAAYHTASLEGGAQSGQNPILTDESLTVWARRLAISAGSLGVLVEEVPIVGLCGDYAPTNVRVRPDGMLYVLDAPRLVVFGIPHWDLTRFLRGIRGAIYVREWGHARADARALVTTLGEAFLSEYRAATALAVFSDSHQRLMLLCETIAQSRFVVYQLRRWRARRAIQTFADAAQLRLRMLIKRPANPPYVIGRSPHNHEWRQLGRRPILS